MDSKQQVIIIGGPTASGKSDIAMELARKINGEIICADSQTVRKRLDIGTAKPSQADRAEIPHHLLDIIEPYDKFSVAEFKHLAEKVILDIQGRDKTPIIVGGTGLYLDSILYDFKFNPSENSQDSGLEDLTVEQLQQRIRDNKWELPVNSLNKRHLIGVLRREGKLPQNTEPRFGMRLFVVERTPEDIKLRIKQRVDLIFENGLIEEVKSITEDFGAIPKSLDAICYPLAKKYIDGELEIDEAKELISRAEWQYARRQLSWWRRNKSAQWIVADKAVEQILRSI